MWEWECDSATLLIPDDPASSSNTAFWGSNLPFRRLPPVGCFLVPSLTSLSWSTSPNPLPAQVNKGLTSKGRRRSRTMAAKQGSRCTSLLYLICICQTNFNFPSASFLLLFDTSILRLSLCSSSPRELNNTPHKDQGTDLNQTNPGLQHTQTDSGVVSSKCLFLVSVLPLLFCGCFVVLFWRTPEACTLHSKQCVQKCFNLCNLPKTRHDCYSVLCMCAIKKLPLGDIVNCESEC